ncbi:uncharacterized protein LOC131440300 [Malaya genurostris]|uniref:uncharacterized protein LOC131440300 n=1 Tax=Malaya genurostris TaxID=325434 RepID=UPI0026F3B18D|nr:uncharacterized protein LOC131440300 [Malaya genurostris]
MPSKQNQKTPSVSCPACNSPDDDEMVQCDYCHSWWHYTCVGVGDSVSEREFKCPKCAPSPSENPHPQEDSKGSKNNSPATESAGKSTKANTPSERNFDQAGSVISSSTKAKTRLNLQKLEAQKALMDRQLELERRDQDRKLEQQKLQKVSEIEKKQLQLDQKFLDEKFRLIEEDLLDEDVSSTSVRSLQGTFNKVMQWRGHVNALMDQPPGLTTQQHVDQLSTASRGVPNPDAQVPSMTLSTAGLGQTSSVLTQGWAPNADLYNTACESVPIPGIHGQSMLPAAGPSTANSVRAHERGPTSQQLATRQVIPRELPSFTGNPEEWPLFISSYNTSTEICGYTEAENLIRLQRCLRGPALEAVRSRLMLPASVPHVIKTLQTLYGRPELLIHMLLQKVREVSPPRSDKLDTLIGFGMTVQTLCDHLQAAGQETHLNNPSLLFELVEKLPGNLKLDWALHKQRYDTVNLQTFAQYMAILTSAASQVTLPVDRKLQRGGKTEKGKQSFCGAHSSEDASNIMVEERSDRERIRTPECYVCKKPDHRVKNCPVFAKMTVDHRWKAVSEYSLCRTCLGAHGRRPCKTMKLCGVGDCQLKHNPLLHSSSRKHESSSKATPSEALTNYHHSTSTTLFRIVPVTLHGNNRTVKTFAFLDDGSSMTLIEETIANQLALEGAQAPLCLQWTANVTRSEKHSKRVSLEITGSYNEQVYPLSNVRTVKNLNLPRQSMQYSKLSKQYAYLKGLPIEDYDDAVPQILIGNDNSHLGAVLKIREGMTFEPIAAKTRLGWTIYGAGKDEESHHSHSYHICQCNRQLHDLVRDNFLVDNIGVAIAVPPDSDESRRANRILRDTTKRIGNNFEVGLLWKFDAFELPDSYAMAIRRMVCLERRMENDSRIGASVKRQIREYIEKGYISKATAEQLRAADPRRIWYLPLGVTINPKKPEKVRIFCDAAAEVDSVSLNTMLLKGPDLLSSLPTVLFGFRERRVAICADIQEMFHQIFIRKEDRQSQRLLWRDAADRVPDVYLMNVATFGASCSPCLAHYVKDLNAAEFAGAYPEAVVAITKKHYVDDYLDSFDDEDKAVHMALDVKYIHSRAGFHLRNWISNSSNVLRRIGEKKVTAGKRLDLHDKCITERVLGMLWDPKQDVFTFSTTMATNTQHPTKRQVLRTVMSLFDPLGLLSHFIIHGKILIQDLWRVQIGWDDLIPCRQHSRWLRWTSEFEKLSCVRVNRCYFPTVPERKIKQLQLHMFVDASEEAYACVAYLRAEVYDGVQVALVAAKSKVAPLKTLSIPKLELQAAVLGTRLQKTIRSTHSLPITESIYWSDSQTVLAWINPNHRKFRQFVSCRVGEILTLTNPEDWRWVPSKDNVADDATKWGKGSHLSPDSRWFWGPSFLYLSEDQWPTNQRTFTETTEELQSCFTHAEVKCENLVLWERFSKWNRLLNTVAYVNRAVRNMQRKSKGSPLLLDCLTQEERSKAETIIWRLVQEEVYSAELSTLATPIPKSSTKRYKNTKLLGLSAFKDPDGIVRMESRIAGAVFVSFDTRNPIIIPKNHHATRLLVEWYHYRYLHANNETVINEIKQRFHISHLRSLVRQISKSCFVCRVRKTQPTVPRMAPLPAARMKAFVRPFSYIGLDYFGPLPVRIGRSVVKRWVALFTCLTIRAVHLEVVHSLSSESCKMAIRRFIARRGSPVEIYSDNGTNFVGASNDLRWELGKIDRDMAAVFTNTNTQWKFNPPSAPHMGGSWERLVRSVKTALDSMYTCRNPDEETFATILLEAESIVNSRPLTFVSMESSEQEAITPNHFLMMSSSGVTQPSRSLEESQKSLRGNWNLIRVMVDQFWKRWVREYLPTLTRRTKWFTDVAPLKVGDLVMVVEDNRRNGWIRGRILELVTGQDGRSRRAVVQTSTGVLRRPIAKLAKLDLEVKPVKLGQDL